MGKKVVNKIVVKLGEDSAAPKLTEHLLRLMDQEKGINSRPLVFLCIGSDRYTGDALGPLVGSYLAEQGVKNIYGCLDSPVHAGNLVDTARTIFNNHDHPVLVAVDACLGKIGEVGNIEAWTGGIEAGIAVGNRLPSVGDIAIIGVVNAGGQLGYLDLHSTPLSIVVKLSKVISLAILTAYREVCASEAAAYRGSANSGINRPTKDT
ncbi:MAG: putative sporulation protein YyaC [Firmicutes bacterium]|nr:putative sporulation protein YyaC [Bacillota bacterium]